MLKRVPGLKWESGGGRLNAELPAYRIDQQALAAFGATARSRPGRTGGHRMSDDDSTLKLYLSHRSALVEYATPIVGCPTRAEDVVQEAYLRYAPAASRGEVRQPVGYLYRVVRNLALDCVRAVGSTERRQYPLSDAEDTPDEAASPERRAEYLDELRAVAEALAELPVRTRVAFEMHRFGDLTLHEIAARLDISVTLAHQLIRTALMHCAHRLGASDDGR